MIKIKQIKNKIKKKYLWRKYHDIAHYMCRGKGLEIGALCYPYLFNSDCQLYYADIYDNNTMRNILKEIPLENLYSQKLVDLDFILKPPKFLLDQIEDNNFDFVYSSHVIEHTPNPISAIIDQIRVIKKGGVVYGIIPNKKNTYDRERKTTPAEVLIDKFKKGVFEHTLEEALDVINNTKDHDLYDSYKNNSDIIDLAKKMIKEKQGMHHYHVFDETNTIEMLLHAINKNNSYIEYFSGFENRDIHFAIKKY